MCEWRVLPTGITGAKPLKEPRCVFAHILPQATSSYLPSLTPETYGLELETNRFGAPGPVEGHGKSPFWKAINSR